MDSLSLASARSAALPDAAAGSRLAAFLEETGVRGSGVRDGRAPGGLQLSELLGALSHALDLTEGQPPGHCLRSCWIGQRIGEALGLPAAQRQELFYAVLLKDLGCSSTAARICELYQADDLRFKHDLRLVDREDVGGMLRFVMRHAGARGGLVGRVRTLASVLGSARQAGNQMIHARCERGADIARQLRFPEAVSDGIRSLDEHWDGRGWPLGIAGERIPLYSRIALLAQVVEVFSAAGGPSAALAEIRRRRGRWFDPALVDLMTRLGLDPAFWERLRAPDLPDELFAMDPARLVAGLDEDYLDDIATAFGGVVDAKSPFTGGHSERVGRLAHAIAIEQGLDADHARWLRRGALLHDVGKLGVSNAILDKPGKLDAEEWAQMRRHAVHTEDVLGRITAFRVLSRIAGAHHERLDGNGYPRGLDRRHIRLETRIITVADIYDAMTSDRPYRAAMPLEKALSIMDADVGTAIDGDCLAALKRVLERGDAA